MVSHVLASGVNGHAIGRRVDARGEHERTVVDKHLGRRSIADNANVAHLVDRLPAHHATATGRRTGLVSKSHLKARRHFNFTTRVTPVIEIAFTMIPVRGDRMT